MDYHWIAQEISYYKVEIEKHNNKIKGLKSLAVLNDNGDLVCYEDLDQNNSFDLGIQSWKRILVNN